MKRSILAICSDLHGGHRYGLLNPETELDEIDEQGNLLRKYHPQLNRIQEYLWGMYAKQIDEIGKFANGDDLVVIMNGDLTAGNKHKQLLVSDRIADQICIGEANAAPWYTLKPRAVRVIKGTGAHVFEQGTSEILITKLLQSAYPETSTSVADHSLLNIGGMTADISHHGPPPGSRTWLEGNEARYYLKSLMMQEIVAGKPPPRLIVRGHYHQEVEETVIIKANGNRYKSTLILVPSFTFIDDYARKVARSPSRITHGMMLVEIVDGEILRIVPLTKTIDIRTKEEIL